MPIKSPLGATPSTIEDTRNERPCVGGAETVLLENFLLARQETPVPAPSLSLSPVGPRIDTAQPHLTAVSSGAIPGREARGGKSSARGWVGV